MHNLKHKSALITGASSGMGWAIAVDLAKAGVQELHLMGRDERRLQELVSELEPHNTSCHTHIVEFSDTSSTEAFCNEFKEKYSNLDLLVHSAGIFIFSDVETSSVEDLDAQYTINLRAPFLLTHHLLPQIKQSKGDIIFINSGAGLTAAPGKSQYAITKHGLKALADSLRKEVKKDGVRVISVYPGKTATAMQQKVHSFEGDEYNPEVLIQAEDISLQVMAALGMSNAATVTDVRVSH